MKPGKSRAQNSSIHLNNGGIQLTVQHSKDLRQKYREDVALHYADRIRMEIVNREFWLDFAIAFSPAIFSFNDIENEWEYEKQWMQRVVELAQSEHTTIPHPTFEMLRKTGTLRVQNRDNGRAFTISLKDWENVIFFVGVDKGPHYQMNISEIEDWLSRLEMVQ